MDELFAPARDPPTLLGRYRVLAPTAGVKVSPLCLGGMNFGSAWEPFMGKCDKKTTFEILDYFYEGGGNFIDTSNNYQNEESEMWIGEWMEKRKNRDQMVIATKYTTNYWPGRKGEKDIVTNFCGNSTKSLVVSVEESLKKLKTSYIDLLYVHWWDQTTSIPELMKSLNRLCDQGKVLYLGVSDTPAWVVSKANQYARDHGLTQFSVYQGNWSASSRDMESDIIPMCRDEGMGIAPWGALGGGNFKTKEQRESNEGRKVFPASEADIRVSEALEKIAKKRGTILTSVALAYVMETSPYVFPIVGGRKLEHLKGNIEALKLRLSDEEMKEIRTASGWSPPFPTNFIFMGKEYNPNLTYANVTLAESSAQMDAPQPQQATFPPGAK